METFCERRERVQTSPELTNQAKAGFDTRYEKCRRYRAMTADESIVQVVDDDGKDWIVDLERRTCTCLMFQEHGGPCPHAAMAARARRVDPYTLFSNAFTLATYRYTYQASILSHIVKHKREKATSHWIFCFSMVWHFLGFGFPYLLGSNLKLNFPQVLNSFAQSR